MQDASVDLWATDEVHFQQHGSRCRMWIPPEIKDPVLLHAPTRKSVGYFGAVRLRDGRFVFRLETGKFNGPSFLQFLQQLRSTSRGTRRRVVVITDNASISPLPPAPTVAGTTRPLTLLWTSFPLTVPNSIRSSECGSSHAVVACTIATSRISKTSSARLNPSSQPGPLATMSSADYAQLLKTLCLV
jgi:hypothetical protein